MTYKSMKILTSCILLTFFSGCKNANDFKSDFDKHKFDPIVINDLRLYDTLRQIILSNYDSFYLSETKKEFTYFYNFDTSTQISGYSNNDIPEIIYPTTAELFNRIGKENIFGFTISRDSTFEILIRNTNLAKYFLDVRERLYWYPETTNINKTAFPFKDTLLTEKWQYQIWYDKRAEF